MGEALLCAPFFSTVCLAANAMLQGASEEQRRAQLPGFAEGRTLATLTSTRADAIGLTARRDGGDWVLSGDERHVLDGHVADLFVAPAREADEGRIGLFLVPGDARGLSRRLLPTMDQTRRFAALGMDDVRVPASARLGQDTDAAPALARTLDLAAVALAAEQTGGAQRCLDLAVEHAKQRVQFGRPIGSFQAIQHACADVMLHVESARSAAYHAACVAAEARDDLPLAASLAKATCSEAYFHAAADCLQIHGGVGFTWEYDAHLHLKRARAGEAFLGDPTVHRERVARHLLRDPA